MKIKPMNILAVLPYIIIESEFTALQGAIHDLKNLKQGFKQTKIFKVQIVQNRNHKKLCMKKE